MRSETSARVLVASAAALILSLGALPSAASPDSDEQATEPSVDVCADMALTARDAAGLAVRCGVEVEVVAERTPWDTTFATPEGLTRVESSASAVRTDVNGVWEPIDTAVVEGEGGLQVVAPAFEMVFSDGAAGQPLARIVKDGHELTFDAPFELTDPVVDGSQVTYPQVLEGVDLVVSVHEDGTGFSEVLRVESPEAAAHPALAELSFPITTSEDLSVAQTDGGFEAVDQAGEQVFNSPAPLMWDSASPVADVESNAPTAWTASTFALTDAPPAMLEDVDARAVAPLSGDRVAEMPADLGAGAVTIVPDPGMLNDPQTQWPVYIDPGVSGNRNEWTLIRSAVPTTVAGYGFSSPAGMGLCDPGATAECSRSNDVHRLIWEFNGLQTVGALASSHVLSATFSAYGAHSWGCAPTGVEAYRVNEISSGTTWSNHIGTWGAFQSSRALYHSKNCGNQGRFEFDVTESARVMADFNTGSVAIGLKAANESSMQIGWKRYGYDATYSVTYNRPPNVPSGLRTSDPDTSCVIGSSRPYIRSVTPSLWATFSDPDGGNVSAAFFIYRDDGYLVWNPGPGVGFSSGLQSAITVPSGLLKNGETYKWYAQARDATGLYGVSTYCEFTIDVLRPGAVPGVTAVHGQPGVYGEDKVGGGVGKAGQFQFDTGGVSDVVSYKYSFNSDALNRGITVAAGGKVTFTPTMAGTQRLYVQSVDRAGNTSDVRLYRFSVDHPSTSSRWSTDDGQGLIAGNTVRPDLPLALNGSAQWVDGPLTEIGMSSTDRALSFSAGGTASTAGPVVNVAQDYAVLANVRLDQVTGTATAVSQDGNSVSGFRVGVRRDAQCPTGDGLCWAAWTSGADDPSAPTFTTLSGAPVTTGAWVMLAAVHDTSSAQLRLYVCDLGGREQPATPVSTLGMTQWTAAGAFRIGRGQAAGLPAEPWNGAIDNVRVFDSIVDVQEIRQQCSSTS